MARWLPVHIRVLFSAELDEVIAKIPDDDLGEVERRLYSFSAKEGLRQAESTKRLRWRHLDSSSVTTSAFMRLRAARTESSLRHGRYGDALGVTGDHRVE